MIIKSQHFKFCYSSHVYTGLYAKWRKTNTANKLQLTIWKFNYLT